MREREEKNAVEKFSFNIGKKKEKNVVYFIHAECVEYERLLVIFECFCFKPISPDSSLQKILIFDRMNYVFFKIQ